MFSKLFDQIQLKFIWSSPSTAYRLYKLAPPSFLEMLRKSNFRSAVRWVNKHSVFYSDLFRKSKIKIHSIQQPSDLGDIYTSPRDIQTRPVSHFICSRPDTSFETTGTISKQPKRIFFSRREIEDAGRVGAAGLWHLGITEHDRVASAFDYSFWVSGPTLKSSLNALGSFHVEAGRISPEEFYDRIRPYGCNILVADPGWLVALSQIAEKRGPWLMNLMMVGGENLSEESRKYIETVWQCKVILTYGQTEAYGMIGAECRVQNGYHLNDMDLWAEIKDPDETGYGELVYTTLRRRTMPLIRYRSGDITKIITEPCSCGSPSIRLAKIRGRIDEMVVTGVGNITSWMIDESIAGMYPSVHAWQLRVSRGEMKDRLELSLESTHSLDERQLREQVLSHMRTSMTVACDGIRQGLADFEVVAVDPGTLKGNHRKLRKIIDERRF